MAEGVQEIEFNKKVDGLTITRLFTKSGENPLDKIDYEKRSSIIRNPDGSIVFEMHDIEIPKFWSSTAVDILAQKYFRKAGVPLYDREGKQIFVDGKPALGSEKSARQVVTRLASCWRYWGEKYGYFATIDDAQAFEDEVKFMLINQMTAPNSPQWFNAGLNSVYGINGPAQGHWYVDPDTKEATISKDAYSHPQAHACFIQPVRDDLVGEGGIMDLAIREARIFKYGSGSGTNFSALRAKGESLSGGGKSSGTMSFLKIFDTVAGSIKSGGTTRRASKMVILNVDHPEIEDFVNWKVKEEKKVAALTSVGYSSDYEGEAYQTVSGQNSNNSVRVPNKFINAVEEDGSWNLTWRTDGRTAKILKARSLWNQIASAAWASADPGIQYDDIINDWHTCPASGRINASNPCSEFMFLDNTSCNLASINLMKFFDKGTCIFDAESFKHAVRIWTIVLEISVLMAQYPSKEIAQLSYDYRSLGLGYTNLGAMLMIARIPYDSEEARAMCSAITAIMTGEAYAASAEMASIFGPFNGYEKNKEHMLRVIRNHRRVAYNAKPEEYENLSVVPAGIDHKICPQYLLNAAIECWDRALELGEKFGYRNAQATLLAPTGTISFVMDCDTTGIEPDFALVKFKKLAGGGFFKIINQSVLFALKNLNYNENETKDIIRHLVGSGSIKNSPFINEMALRNRGFSGEDISKIERSMPAAFELSNAFNLHTLGKECMERLGIPEEEYSKDDFNLLRSLGFSEKEISVANDFVCGTMSIEGAPYLKEEHYAVFDCASKCGKGERFIQPIAHVKMMAAAQPFLSGAISKTVNMPNKVTADDIKEIYMESWKLGLKSIAIYRDGCKLSQPLSVKSEKEKIEVIPTRKKMPAERQAITHKFRIGNQEGYLTVGLFEDGAPGEVFIKVAKQGSTLSGLMDSFALVTSISLQYGTPLKVLVGKFINHRFEPMGWTDTPSIPIAKSIMDYIFRWIALKFLTKEDLKELGLLNGNSTIVEDIVENNHANVRKIDEFTDDSKYDTKGDAPACHECGSMMIRSGTCYVCTTCGTTSGCS